MPVRRRRRIDRLVAAALAVVVVAVGLTIYLTSDIRATTSVTGPSTAAPDPMLVAPTSLTQRWTLHTDAALGAIASPYGTVVTADTHTVTGHDAVTGAQRWSYRRSNLPLCAIGSGDTSAYSSGGGVSGIMTVYEKNRFCSQFMLLDPTTGARGYARTSPMQPGGSLVFGGPYAGWLGPDLIEVWRFDLVRTSQYGNQPNPTESGTRRLGCTFTDLALAQTQFATIEHCPAESSTARVVLNWADPGSAPDAKAGGWDVFNHPLRADIDTGSPQALIVGLTADRVAVLVAAPVPAVVVYDIAGKEISRTPVAIPASAVLAAAGHGATPSVTSGQTRYSLVGSYVVAVTASTVQAPAPVTTTATTAPTTGLPALPTVPTTAPTSPAMVDVQSPALSWVAPDALGLPAAVGQQVLMPVRAGLAVLDGTGQVVRTIPVDRGGYTGRVDVATVGAMVIETRGDTVVGLS